MLDNLFKLLHSDGIGSTSSHAVGISKEEENAFWDYGSSKCPFSKGCYVQCSMFLRGSDEHRNFSLSKLEHLYQPDRYVYRTTASKKRQGGLKQTQLEHRVVIMKNNKRFGNRCPVFFLDNYTCMSKLPAELKKKNLFYCRACPNAPTDPLDPFYRSVPIGKNTLCTMVKTMFTESGLSGNKSNHS